MLQPRLPLWYQVAEGLRAQIMAARPTAPMRLPTEADLATRFGVSLITVRQAMKTLEEEGLVERHRRRGTFANPMSTESASLKLLGSVETVYAQQVSEETELLGRERLAPPPEVARLMPDAGEVMLIRRIRRTGGASISYACNYLRPEHARQVKPAQLRTRPVTRILRENLGVAIAHIDNTLEARLATPEIAAALDVKLLSPVLFLEGVSRDAVGRVVDVAHIHYRGDRYRFGVRFDMPVN